MIDYKKISDKAEASNVIENMLNSGADFDFEGAIFEDFGAPVTAIASMARDTLSEEEFDVCCQVVRDELADKGITAPDGKFIYFGGRFVSADFLFLSGAEKAELAKKMAGDIIAKMGSEEETPYAGVVDAIMEAAVMGDEMLAARTAVLADAMREKGGAAFGGNFTFLPDGSVLFLETYAAA